MICALCNVHFDPSIERWRMDQDPNIWGEPVCVNCTTSPHFSGFRYDEYKNQMKYNSRNGMFVRHNYSIPLYLGPDSYEPTGISPGDIGPLRGLDFFCPAPGFLCSVDITSSRIPSAGYSRTSRTMALYLGQNYSAREHTVFPYIAGTISLLSHSETSWSNFVEEVPS